MVDDGVQVTKKIEDALGIKGCCDSFLWFWVREFGIVSREELLMKVEELDDNVKTICRSYVNHGDAMSAISMSMVYDPSSFYELEEKCRTHLEEQDAKSKQSDEQATAKT